MSIYPPLLGAGVRVRRIGERPLAFETSLRLRWWNRNWVGTHYGGSLYNMADPFFMLILVDALGPGFVVWDKAASIRFRRPGRGVVKARFEIPPSTIEEIRREAELGGRAERTFRVEIRDEAGETVAEVEKLVHVRRRDRPD